jgi:hypothetical protein
MPTYLLCFSKFYPDIQSIEKQDSRSQKSKSEISIHHNEKPNKSGIYKQPRKHPRITVILTHAFDNNCPYWMENKLFLFLFYFILFRRPL